MVVDSWPSPPSIARSPKSFWRVRRGGLIMSRRHHDFDNVYENRLHNALTRNQLLGHLACCDNGGGLKDDLQRSGVRYGRQSAYHILEGEVVPLTVSSSFRPKAWRRSGCEGGSRDV